MKKCISCFHKIFISLVLCILALPAFSACKRGIPTVPVFSSSIDQLDPSAPKPAKTANVFFQNTDSMKGFINTNKKNALLCAMDSIKTALVQYSAGYGKSSHIYYLKQDVNSAPQVTWWEAEEWEWDSYKYPDKDHYTIDETRGWIDSSNGPMMMLTKDYPQKNRLKKEDLNIIVTNLVEHNNRLVDVGTYIFNNIVGCDGCHAVMFAARSPFSGNFNTVDPLALDPRQGGNGININPTDEVIYPLFYVIAMGPSTDVDAFADNFQYYMNKVMDNYVEPNEFDKREANEAFYTRTDIYASGGVMSYTVDYTTTPLDIANAANKLSNPHVAPTAFSQDRNLLLKYLTTKNSSLCLNMELMNLGDYFEGKAKNMFVFRHNTMYSESKLNDVSQLNFRIPLVFSPYVNTVSLLSALQIGNKMITVDLDSTVVKAWVSYTKKDEGQIKEWKKLSLDTVKNFMDDNFIIEFIVHGTEDDESGRRKLDDLSPADANRKKAYDGLNSVNFYSGKQFYDEISGGYYNSLEFVLTTKGTSLLRSRVRDGLSTDGIRYSEQSPILYFEIPIIITNNDNVKVAVGKLPAPEWVQNLTMMKYDPQNVREMSKYTSNLENFYNAMIDFQNGRYLQHTGKMTLTTLRFVLDLER